MEYLLLSILVSAANVLYPEEAKAQRVVSEKINKNYFYIKLEI